MSNKNKDKEQNNKKKTLLNGAFKHFWKVLKEPRWLWIVLIVGVIIIILLLISEGQFPSITLSNGIVAFISAVIGVLLTAFAVSCQLKQQSDIGAQKDKDVNIYNNKIKVYSKFTSKMWKILESLNEDESVPEKNLKDLRNYCFSELIFYLNQEQVNKILEQIKEIDKDDAPTARNAAGEITCILRNSLLQKEFIEDDEGLKSGALQKLFYSFDKKDKEQENVDLDNKQIDTPKAIANINFWHFNMWGEQQIEAFKNENWVLNLFEYGEEWRTNTLKRVKPDDIVFLFRRGGYGYIGAFRVSANKVLKDENYAKEDVKKYDIYGVMEDGATYSSNLIVKPIAYNFKGIGYRTVRRRTIEPMIDDLGNVKFLFNRFKGNDLEWDSSRRDGKDKLDLDTPVKLDEEYLKKLKEQYNL
jgi:hypothetical protein